MAVIGYPAPALARGGWKRSIVTAGFGGLAFDGKGVRGREGFFVGILQVLGQIFYKFAESLGEGLRSYVKGTSG